MNLSDYVSVIALLVALYAAVESTKANKISLHPSRLEIYQKVRKFVTLVDNYSCALPTVSQLEDFYEEVIVVGDLVFDKETMETMCILHKKCEIAVERLDELRNDYPDEFKECEENDYYFRGWKKKNEYYEQASKICEECKELAGKLEGLMRGALLMRA